MEREDIINILQGYSMPKIINAISAVSGFSPIMLKQRPDYTDQKEAKLLAISLLATVGFPAEKVAKAFSVPTSMVYVLKSDFANSPVSELERAIIDKLKGNPVRYKKNQDDDKIKAYHRAYYKANKEKIKAYHKAYYEENKEMIKAYNRAYHKANKEKINAYQDAANKKKKAERAKRYYEANKEELNAKRRAYYRAKRQKMEEEQAKRRTANQFIFNTHERLVGAINDYKELTKTKTNEE